MLGMNLKDIEHSITFKIKYERPEIKHVNVFNSIFLMNEFWGIKPKFGEKLDLCLKKLNFGVVKNNVQLILDFLRLGVKEKK